MPFTIAGYATEPPFYESKNTLICRARQLADGMRVIVKAVAGPAMTRARIAHLRHEHRMLAAIDSPFVPRLIGFDEQRGRHAAILMEDISAPGSLDTFASDTLDLITILELAIAVASALDATHRAQIIHYDVKPRNIIWAPDTGRVQLIDFGLAMRLATDDPELSGQEDLIGTLPYISPEQTGRMNCRVDHRSDLYSLGIVLYRLLAGELPFEARDPIGWVHAHIAIEAIPLCERDPGVPAAISAIVERLMEKDRDRRYQSAGGLLADLRSCAAQLRKTGWVSPFPLGTSDQSHRLRVADRLYGRDPQLASLIEAFERVSADSRVELVLVSGEPGAGKSSLVLELQKPLAARRGHMISGKFDLLQRTTPLTGIVAAFDDLVRQLLDEPAPRLARWRKSITRALGRNGRVLTDLVPALELVIGPQPPIAELEGAERLARFKLAIERFVAALARPKHPLVLFIDDLQWADPASLGVLEHLLGSTEIRSLLVIGAYRSNEVDAVHPLTRMLERPSAPGLAVQRLELGPLPLSEVQRLLADSLRCEASAVHPLATIVHAKTGGNAFFLRQFVAALHHEGVIRFDHERLCWAWDLDRSGALPVTDNVTQLLLERLDELPESTRRLLQLAGCIGNRFDLLTLARIARLESMATFVALWPALEHRLVHAEGKVHARLRDADAGADEQLEPDEAAAMIFRFQHDRVQQAAVASIRDERGRQQIRLEIGRMLIGQLEPAARAARRFEIADQLNAGRARIEDRAEQLSTAELNLSCGRQALAAAAYESALDYLRVGAELLGETHEPHSLWFAIHLELARAHYLTGNYAEAKRKYPELQLRAESDEERLDVYAVEIEHLMVAAEYPAGIEAACAALAILGVEVPPSEDVAAALTIEEIAAVEANLAGRDIAGLLDARRMESARHQRVLVALDHVANMAYVSGAHELHSWVIARMTNISLVHGNANTSSVGYANFANIMTRRGSYARARSFGELGLALAGRLLDPRMLGRASISYQVISGFFHRPLHEVAREIQRNHQSSLEGGDLYYVGAQILYGHSYKLASSAPLTEMREEIRDYLPLLRRVAPVIIDVSYVPQVVYLTCALMDEPLAELELEFDPSAFIEQFESSPYLLSGLYVSLTKLEMLIGEPAGLAELEGRIRAVELGVAGLFLVPEHRLYAALQLLELLRRPTEPDGIAGEARERTQQLIEGWRVELASWAAQCPANFRFTYALIEAERARGAAHIREAMAAYEVAITAAAEEGCVDHEALARRLYGEFWLELGATSNADAQLSAALSLYRSWGAARVVRALEARYPHLRVAPRSLREELEVPLPDTSSSSSSSSSPSSPSSSSRSSSDSRRSDARRTGISDRLDLETVTRAARAISSETTLDGLLNRLATIIRNNIGAQRCLILRPLGDDWEIAARSLPSDAASDERGFSSAIARYVGRSGEFLVVDDAGRSSRWIADEYVQHHRPRSLLCAPIRLKDRPLALVYAENNLTDRAFTDGHLTLLHTVLAQAAISIENARLFEALDHERARWHALVRNAADLILILDRQHRIEFVNRPSTRFPLAPEPGTDIAESFLPVERARLRASIDHVFATGAQAVSEGVVKVGEQVHHLGIRLGPIRRDDDSIDSVSLIATDLTERRRLADHVRQSQKLEAIGTLAGGVAHDFNNLLTVILGAAEIGQLRQPDPATAELFKEILAAGERAGALTRKLLAFSRKQVLQPKVVELDGLIEGLASLLARMLGEDIAIELALDGEGGSVQVDPGELEQALINLSVNARDAMPRGGRLRISTRRIRDPGSSTMAVAVSDEGAGMDAATQERVFEPFFTTKAVGQGTGLGLAMVHGIVEQSGGWVELESELGVGTTVTLYFPEQRKDLGTGTDAALLQTTPRGSETILLVEDDPQVRALGHAMLERLGYRIIAATSGAEALEIARETAQIDLLLTDVVMPGLSGPELAERLRKERAAIRVLFTSGYTNDAIVRHGLLDGSMTLLSKPFSLATMARKVREALDG